MTLIWDFDIIFKNFNSLTDEEGVISMKKHRFWVWCAVICMIMALITGYRRK